MSAKRAYGKIYGVGVGPGDPSLLTLKAAAVLLSSPVVAFPGKNREESMAYQTARAALPELEKKEVLPLCFPMTRDPDEKERALKKAARQVEKVLKQGKDVCFVTIGDVCIYSTFWGIAPLLKRDGFEIEVIPGVPSFCAASARLLLPLVYEGEELHVFPHAQRPKEDLPPGTCVFMKAGTLLPEVKKKLQQTDREVYGASNLGRDGERLYRSLSEIPEDAGYFTVVIAREKDE
ncbi:MAG: precorrin-2 C(20)-methyltransferase [Blautia sp.]|nr:precorrin-2 C(20)-methyltransferase [Blautia sp.]